MFIQKAVWFQNFPLNKSCSYQYGRGIQQALNKDEFACGVFLDFQKTFDTVNHNILIPKLNHYGTRGVTLDWFQSHLKNRKQQTSINNTLSNETVVSYGVPQGSVLGHLLFLYIY